MGIVSFPAGGSSSSPIKSIQRGVAASAGNITISAVNTAKTMVRSFSTGSSGTVAATGAIGSQSISANVAAHSVSGNIAAHNATLSREWIYSGPAAGPGNTPISITATTFSGNSAAASIPGNISATNITGGSTNLTSAEFGIYLVDSTTITATGACRWEVIEFN